MVTSRLFFSWALQSAIGAFGAYALDLMVDAGNVRSTDFAGVKKVFAG
jgi:hypothetical protein